MPSRCAGVTSTLLLVAGLSLMSTQPGMWLRPVSFPWRFKAIQPDMYGVNGQCRVVPRAVTGDRGNKVRVCGVWEQGVTKVKRTLITTILPVLLATGVLFAQAEPEGSAVGPRLRRGAWTVSPAKPYPVPTSKTLRVALAAAQAELSVGNAEAALALVRHAGRCDLAQDATAISPTAMEHLADAIRFSLRSLGNGAFVVAGMVARGFAGCRSVMFDTALIREAAVRTDPASQAQLTSAQSYDYATCYETDCDAAWECCNIGCADAVEAGRRYCEENACTSWYEAYVENVYQACYMDCVNEWRSAIASNCLVFCHSSGVG